MNSPLPLLRILLADPHPIVLEGLRALLCCQGDMEVVGQAACAQETLDLFCTLMPDVLVMEVDQPDQNGIELIQTLTQRFPAARILVLSYHTEEEIIYRALQAGAKGYYLQDAKTEEVVNAVRLVGGGGQAFSACVGQKLADRVQRQKLTHQELVILAQIMAGGSNQEIADKLFISVGTVKVHVINVLRKLEVQDRTQAVVIALQRGLIFF